MGQVEYLFKVRIPNRRADDDPDPGLFHWLHIVISNAKAFILGTYHGLPKKFLQPNLDEYHFRFSCRGLGLRLLERLVARRTLYHRPGDVGAGAGAPQAAQAGPTTTMRWGCSPAWCSAPTAAGGRNPPTARSRRRHRSTSRS